jgi:hypothetical protein
MKNNNSRREEEKTRVPRGPRGAEVWSEPDWNSKKTSYPTHITETGHIIVIDGADNDPGRFRPEVTMVLATGHDSWPTWLAHYRAARVCGVEPGESIRGTYLAMFGVDLGPCEPVEWFEGPFGEEERAAIREADGIGDRPAPWRDVLTDWPATWRERWGNMANEIQDEGASWHEAERRAFDEISRFKKIGGKS